MTLLARAPPLTPARSFIDAYQQLAALTPTPTA